MKKIGVAYFKMLEKNEENHDTSLPIAGLLSKMLKQYTIKVLTTALNQSVTNCHTLSRLHSLAE